MRGMFRKENILGVDKDTHIEYHNRSTITDERLSNRTRVTEQGVKVIDGVTVCCGYDLGPHYRRANYCPVCGEKIVERK